VSLSQPIGALLAEALAAAADQLAALRPTVGTHTNTSAAYETACRVAAAALVPHVAACTAALFAGAPPPQRALDVLHGLFAPLPAVAVVAPVVPVASAAAPVVAAPLAEAAPVMEAKAQTAAVPAGEFSIDDQ
jgi:hypothetical protein